MKLPKLVWNGRDAAKHVAETGRGMVRRADQARDAGAFGKAAILYAEAVRLLPQRADLHVQAGHMHKELGEFDQAEWHYRAALARMPHDADLALQFGHFYKSAGRLTEAVAAYERALGLKNGWDAPQEELAKIERAGWGGGAEASVARPDADATDSAGLPLGLAERPLEDLLTSYPESIEFRRLGRRERTYWGLFPVLRGVEAIRGYCISQDTVASIELHLQGELVYRGVPAGSYPLLLERHSSSLRKFVFNIWLDVSGFAPGRYALELRALRASSKPLVQRVELCVDAALPPSLLPESDALVPTRDPADERSLVAQINGRPSQVRAAGERLLKEPPRCVLVQRVDQLGDLVVSVPALRRLRALFPDARLVGLVSEANADLARTLHLFDDIVTVNFPTAEWEPRRVLTPAGLEHLTAQLGRFTFDVAIDLSEAESSRLLLPLSKAPILIGFRSGQFPGLDIDISANTYDKANDHEIVPHAKKALGLIEWLATLLETEPNLAVRNDLDRDRLGAFGLPAGTRFAILHAGARAKFSRWPHYLELARLIVERTDLHVVMMTTETAPQEPPPALARSDRFQLLNQKLDFDDFDALLSFCTIFVGDDSGPKHLAALRGANVISVQTARNNWIEWGQTSGGSIVTRRVPCAGCLIQTDVEAQECGRDIVCLTQIRAEEVFAVVERQLGEGA